MKKAIQPEGNYFNKYKSGNFIIKIIMKKFFSSIDNLLSLISYKTVYEAGCGEGEISNFVYELSRGGGISFTASDISEKIISQAKIEYPYINFKIASIYKTGESRNKYNLVIASEVLEHLEYPEKALKELFKISNKYVLISVPNEPLWRILNMCRGKYLSNFGNTPGHIQHWTKKSFIKMLSKYGKIVKISFPIPWIVVLLKVKK